MKKFITVSNVAVQGEVPKLAVKVTPENEVSYISTNLIITLEEAKKLAKDLEDAVLEMESVEWALEVMVVFKKDVYVRAASENDAKRKALEDFDSSDIDVCDPFDIDIQECDEVR